MTVEDIALGMTPGIGIKGCVHLLECFGDARSIFAASADELVGRAALRADLARSLVQRKAFAAAEREIAHCRRHDIGIVVSTDADYPPLLREIPDYPHVLYVKGDTTALAGRTLAMVGTREATPYGQAACNRLVEELSRQAADLTIVSGLAFGIDAAAHRAAVAHGLKSVAVLPCYLPDVVPAQHGSLARDLIAHGGALVSELPSSARLNGTAYIARNRIIAGLSAGCVVVESPASGGSLVTAHQADGYFRPVMALPGRATDRASAGTNHLIRSHKAQMILTARDILDELGWHAADRTPSADAAASLTPDERGLLGCFRTDDPLSTEELQELCGLDPGTLATLLVGLELAGAVRQLPGNRYMKLQSP